MLVFARCIGCIARAPGFSHPGVPPMLRAALAFVLALGLAPRVAPAPLHTTSFVAALALEVLIGAAIGFAASLLYEGASAGGKVLDSYVGMQSANPNAQVASGEGYGALWGVVFLAAFFLLDGYQWVVRALVASLDGLPLGTAIAPASLRTFAFALPGVLMRASALVAGPAIVMGLVAQIGVGAIGRVVPRFSNMTLTFPVVFGAVLLVTLATVPLLVQQGGRPWLVLPFPH